MRPNERKYMNSHEWAKQQGDLFTIGITDFAVEKLGDLVFLELPETGVEIKKGERLGEVESVKAVSDIYAPISGTVSEVNSSLPDNLETLSQDPFAKGWLVKIKSTANNEFAALLDAAAYEKVVEEES